MPWHLEYGNADCADDQWAVVKDDDGSIEGCHPTRADAVSQLAALNANEPDTLAAAAMPTPEGGMIALLPSAEDQARLALEGYELPESLHVTCCYLGDVSMLAPDMRQGLIGDAAAAAAGIAPFQAEAFGVAIFNPAGDSPCLVFTMSGDALADAGMALPHPDMGGEQHRPWIPHITLAYDSDPELLMGEDVTARLGPVTFDRVRVAFAGEVTDIVLGGALDPQVVDEHVDDYAEQVAVVAAMPVIGTPFEGVLLVEGVPDGSSPRRTFAPDSLTFAPTPLPFKAQLVDEEGHEGAIMAGRIDEIFRDPANTNVIRIAGMFDDLGAGGAEALRQVRNQMLRGVSLMADDIDQADVEYVFPDLVAIEPMIEDEPAMPDMGAADGPEFHLPGKHNQKDHGSGGMKWSKDQLKSFDKKSKPLHSDEAYRKRFGSAEAGVVADGGPELDVIEDGEPESAPTEIIYHAGRVRSVTLVAEPAYIESEIHLLDVPEMVPTRVEMPVTAAGGAWTITIPELWPEEWFAEPLPDDMPSFGALRITASGRITGYLAPPNVVHRAFRASGRPVTVPTRQDYSEFNNKPALVAGRDGGVATINAGNITFNCGHPDALDPRRANPSWAREVYDNTCSVVARVRIWESPRYPGAPIVAGALLHGVDADTIERMMGSALSGDWQGGKLNAALLVPVEGFPTAVTSSVRMREGQMVASSVPVLFERRTRDQFDDLARRLKLDPESQFAGIRERLGL